MVWVLVRAALLVTVCQVVAVTQDLSQRNVFIWSVIAWAIGEVAGTVIIRVMRRRRKL